MGKIMDAADSILIIDDDKGLRLALRAVLEGLGVGVSEAADGPEGLLGIVRDRPSLVLLDVSLPGMPPRN